MNRDELIRLLKVVEEIPCKAPKGIHTFANDERVGKIDEEIRNSNSHYKLVKGKNYYRLYAQDTLENLAEEYNDIILVSSHADNRQEASSYDDKSDPGYLNGCFDNSSTNSVCLYLMKYEELPRNVVFAFTADEEDDCKGASHVAKKLIDICGKEKLKAIVLDDTYGFQNGVDFTIENDYIYKKNSGEEFIQKVCNVINESGYSWNFLYSDEEKDEGKVNKYVRSQTIKEYMKEGLKAYKEVKGQDETEKYAEYKISTFSMCLPCSGTSQTMHSPKGFKIRIDTVCNYTDALGRILKAFEG